MKKSTFSFHYLILFILLFSFKTLKAEEKPITLTFQKCKELKKKANFFHREGNKLIEPLLAAYFESNESNYFTETSNFIENFPFSDYPLYRVKEQGLFFVNDIFDTIKNSLRKGLVWEPGIRDLIKKYVKPGSVVLDIGSHVGTHSITMSKCVGANGKVIAFEPCSITYRELCYNLAANKTQNVLPVRAAIGKTLSSVDVITSHPHNEGGKYVVESVNGEDIAIQVRLDDLGLENISLIKIDVENMEADVLDGAKETLCKNRPILLIEIQGNGERPVQLDEDTKEMAKISKQKLESLDYSLIFLGGADYLCFPN